jgi:outer membrane beta-barrel protein
MRKGILTIALTGLVCGYANISLAANDVAAVDGEQFEVGLYTGILAVEDFGSEALTGIELTYHLRKNWLVQGSYGRAQVDPAAFETSQRQFLSGGDRDFEYLALTGGYRLFGGRSFWSSDARFNSAIHVMAGPERVSFAGGDEWGLNAGLSYRLVFADWLTANVDFREHFVERDFLGDSKNTVNTELRIGINALF